MKNNQTYSLGIVGVRGFVGKELLALLLNHPLINTAWLSSRQLKGQAISAILDDDLQVDVKNDCIIESLTAEQVAEKGSDIIILALPNGLAAPFVKALEEKGNTRVIIDLSADYRFDDDWIYSVPELDSKALIAARSQELIKISNPGCYATAMQLALAPIIDLLASSANCFGVSGYSGAGTKPSPYNDPLNLQDNIIGYKLVEHLHEKEVSARLQKSVSFSPSVAEFFRGINMTTQVKFSEPQNSADLYRRYEKFYQDWPLIKLQQDMPVIKQVVNTAYCLVGGITLSSDGLRATIVSCLDNLLKGAASQAIQNINIALGIDPLMSLEQNSQPRAGEL